MSNIDKLANVSIPLIVEKRRLDNKFMIHFDDTYESDNGGLIGIFGTGESVEEAATNYYEKIKCKTMIVNPFSSTRRTITFI